MIILLRLKILSSPTISLLFLSLANFKRAAVNFKIRLKITINFMDKPSPINVIEGLDSSYFSSWLQLCLLLRVSEKAFHNFQNQGLFCEFLPWLFRCVFRFPGDIFEAFGTVVFEFFHEKSSIISQLAAAFCGLSRFSAENPGYYASVIAVIQYKYISLYINHITTIIRHL